MNSNEKGNIGLAKIATDLLENNCFVFLPFTDTTCVDLIVANEKMETKRMQIKYRSMSNGCIELPLNTVVNGKKIPVNLEKIDLWALYCPDNKQIYYISKKDLEKKKYFKIRILQPKQKQANMNYGENYTSILKAWNK